MCVQMVGFNSAVLYVHKRFPYLWRRAWWGQASGGVLVLEAADETEIERQSNTHSEPRMTRARSRSVNRKTD